VAAGRLGRITRGDLRRIARRGGVKRVAVSSYAELRIALDDFLQPLLLHAIAFSEHAGQRTLTAASVVHALRLDGSRLYGFEAGA